MTRTFRFGLTLERTSDQDRIAEQARRAEELGYSCMVVTDHLDDRNGPLVTITAAALATSTLRVGTLVLCNDYRHPVVLAKELATLDRLSGGRLEVGLGAGWMTTDYEQAGLVKDRPGVRIERLAEAVSVMDGCFGDGPFDFAGQHYTVRGLDAGPKPVQRPRPPLLMAGGGPKMLALAAQRADIVAVNVSLRAGVIDERVAADATAEATDEKVALVRDVAGDRLGGIELSVGVFIAAIVDNRRAFAEALAPGFGITAEAALDSPHALFGTVDDCVAVLEERRRRWGVSYVTIPAEAAVEFAPVVERLTGR
ncbi:MAG: TIGR03621 family F420-dependent LLM class oxidoreductase [Acidimicrobiia bacterium]|nr:TIGR03621 family F420-dependent LLM class oxidoreductase [Acidimicrobiia bacterium]